MLERKPDMPRDPLIGRQSEVPVVEPISFQVRDFLREQGYAVGSSTGFVDGWATGKPQDSWGIFISPERSKPKRILGVKLPTGDSRLPMVGVIKMRFPRPEKLADIDWLIEVYGRQYVERMADLARSIQERFEKRTGVYLEDENTQLESRHYDWV